ncbi:MAG: winged helix-turn-helix transcriptional regulator [Paracoccaceae bacterium]|nr:winged helix-turn-helix transcriptional regulator [Paracoccaceae bacterium]
MIIDDGLGGVVREGQNLANSSTTSHPCITDVMRNSRRVAEVLKSLAHPARLLIVHRLSKGEASFKELIALLTLPQPTISKQLARLREGGLIDAQREGRSVSYRLHEDKAGRVIEQLRSKFGSLGPIDSAKRSSETPHS